MTFRKFAQAAVLAASCAFAPPAFAAGFGALSEPGDIATMGDTPIIDIRGADDFAAGHIPGAVNAPYPMWRGPRDNPGRVPDEAALEALLQSLGLQADNNVLIVHEGRNATDFGAAARVYWTLKSSGFGELSILNGGYNAWVTARGTPETGAVTPTPSTIDITFSDDWMIDRDGVKDVVLGKSDAVLIDARPLDFFEGKQAHPAAQQAGTLAGALNIVHSTWFQDESPVIAPEQDALSRLKNVAADRNAPLVSFCNTGHWAATNWFAASELAGIEGVKLYPESMVGWTLLGGDVVNGDG